GVALLASTHEIGRLISAHAAELGAYSRTASIFGAGNLIVAPPFAAQANGTMANALDYDAGAHRRTHILPAVLAVAEEDAIAGRGFTGDPEIIEAPLGFVAAIATPEERDETFVSERLGNPFVLEKFSGVRRYPAVTPSHGVITAALKLAEHLRRPRHAGAGFK